MLEVVDRDYIVKGVTEIFGADNLAVAFITGSMAAGTATPTSDVDVLICHRDGPDLARRAQFTDFYLSLHEDLGRQPDVVSPGEVMSMGELSHGLNVVASMEPALVVAKPIEFDYICWAGMLVSKKELLVPRTPELGEYEDIAASVVARWVSRLFGSMHTTDATGMATDKDKILGRRMSCPGYYDAHE